MRRALDELAEAISTAHGSPSPCRIATSVELRRQFSLPITPSRWAVLAQHLACPLPALDRPKTGLWAFPHGWKTVWDIVDYLAGHRPDLQRPHS